MRSCAACPPLTVVSRLKAQPSAQPSRSSSWYGLFTSKSVAAARASAPALLSYTVKLALRASADRRSLEVYSFWVPEGTARGSSAMTTPPVAPCCVATYTLLTPGFAAKSQPVQVPLVVPPGAPARLDFIAAVSSKNWPGLISFPTQSRAFPSHGLSTPVMLSSTMEYSSLVGITVA